VLCDIVLRRPMPFSEVLSHQNDVLILDRVFGRAGMAQLDQYASWAEEVGFSSITTLDISRETKPTFDRWRTNADLNAKIVEELIGSEGLASFRACDILSRFWLDWLGYGLLVADRKG